MRVFEDGHGLLTRHIRKTIEVFVEAQAAFQIGEQAVHRHAGDTYWPAVMKALDNAGHRLGDFRAARQQSADMETARDLAERWTVFLRFDAGLRTTQTPTQLGRQPLGGLPMAERSRVNSSTAR